MAVRDDWAPGEVLTSADLNDTFAAKADITIIRERNGIINGAMNVSQRGTSFTASANNDDVYTLDRWNLLSDGNDAVDVTQATDAPTGFKNSIGLDVETANKKFGILQIIENKNAIQYKDKQVTLSFYAKTTGLSIADVKAVVLSWSSTADTVTSDVVSAWNASGTVPTWAANWTAENTPANLNVTNSWARYSVTATVDTASMANVAVFIWCDDASTTAGDFLYVTGVQVEVGPVATPFEFEDYGTTLRKCQRYFCMSYNMGTLPGANVGGQPNRTTCATSTPTGISAHVRFQQTMRDTPSTVTLYASNGTTGQWTWDSIGVGNEQKASSADQITANGFYVLCTALAANRNNCYGHWTASAEL